MTARLRRDDFHEMDYRMRYLLVSMVRRAYGGGCTERFVRFVG